MGFLDDVGATRLWAKIKDRYDNTIASISGPTNGKYNVSRVNGSTFQLDAPSGGGSGLAIKNLTPNGLVYIATREDDTTFNVDRTPIIPINPSPTPTTNGAIWFTT